MGQNGLINITSLGFVGIFSYFKNVNYMSLKKDRIDIRIYDENNNVVANK